jgi:hypothetical protein
MKKIRQKLSQTFLKQPKTSNRASEQPIANGIPELILAFRTITTMLSYIQRETPSSRAKPRPSDAAQRYELKILNALATLLVRENEVVAVVANPASHPGSIEVIVSPRSMGPSVPLTTFQPGLGDYFRQFLTTINPRHDGSRLHDSLHPTTDGAAIVHSRDALLHQPEFAVLDGMALFKRYIEVLW